MFDGWNDERFLVSEDRYRQLHGGAKNDVPLTPLDCPHCGTNSRGGQRSVMHQQVHTENGCVDEFIAPLLRELWYRGVPTVFSCQEEDPVLASHSSGYHGELFTYTIGYVICETLADGVRALEIIHDVLQHEKPEYMASVSVRSALLYRGATGGEKVLRGVVAMPSPMLAPLARLLEESR